MRIRNIPEGRNNFFIDLQFWVKVFNSYRFETALNLAILS